MNNYFLDQGVIVGYANHIFDKAETEDERLISETDNFAEASARFIEIKEEKVLLTCFYIINHDLPKFLIRRAITIEEMRRKVRDNKYEIGSSDSAKKHLYPRDIALANKIFLIKNLFEGKENKFLDLLLEIETIFEKRINFFISKILNKIVIPIEEIDRDLVWHLHTFIDNFSDCNVMASAIQCNTNLFKIIVITTDKKDYKAIENCLDTNLKLSEKYKMPSWRYLLDIT